MALCVDAPCVWRREAPASPAAEKTPGGSTGTGAGNHPVSAPSGSVVLIPAQAPGGLAAFDAAVRKWLEPLLPGRLRVVTDAARPKKAKKHAGAVTVHNTSIFVCWVMDGDDVLHEFWVDSEKGTHQNELEYEARQIADKLMSRSARVVPGRK